MTTRHALWELWAFLQAMFVFTLCAGALLNNPLTLAVLGPIAAVSYFILLFLGCFAALLTCGVRHRERIFYRVVVTPTHITSVGNDPSDALSVPIHDIAFAQHGYHGIVFLAKGTELYIKGPDGLKKVLPLRSFGCCYHDGQANGPNNCCSNSMPPDHVFGPCLSDPDGFLKSVDYAMACSIHAGRRQVGAGKDTEGPSRTIAVEVMDDGSSWEGFGLRSARVQSMSK